GASNGEILPDGIVQLVIAEPHLDGYDRDLFGGEGDADHDCQNTRAEVLIAESRVPVTFTSPASCTVATGQWVDPWSGASRRSRRRSRSTTRSRSRTRGARVRGRGRANSASPSPTTSPTTATSSRSRQLRDRPRTTTAPLS